jgi:hypothetical protein
MILQALQQGRVQTDLGKIPMSIRSRFIAIFKWGYLIASFSHEWSDCSVPYVSRLPQFQQHERKPFDKYAPIITCRASDAAR